MSKAKSSGNGVYYRWCTNAAGYHSMIPEAEFAMYADCCVALETVKKIHVGPMGETITPKYGVYTGRVVCFKLFNKDVAAGALCGCNTSSSAAAASCYENYLKQLGLKEKFPVNTGHAAGEPSTAASSSQK